jgi:hypothetical protein
VSHLLALWAWHQSPAPCGRRPRLCCLLQKKNEDVCAKAARVPQLVQHGMRYSGRLALTLVLQTLAGSTLAWRAPSVCHTPVRSAGAASGFQFLPSPATEHFATARVQLLASPRSLRYGPRLGVFHKHLARINGRSMLFASSGADDPALLNTTVMRVVEERDAVIPAPDFRLSLSVLAIGIQLLNMQWATLGTLFALLGSFLALQTTRLRFRFTSSALDVLRVKGLAYTGSEEADPNVDVEPGMPDADAAGPR